MNIGALESAPYPMFESGNCQNEIMNNVVNIIRVAVANLGIAIHIRIWMLLLPRKYTMKLEKNSK